MKRHIIMVIVGVLILVVSVAFSQQTPRSGNPKGNLHVIVDGFQNEEGLVKIGLCDSKESFQKSEGKTVINNTAKITGGKAEQVFAGVPYGTYALTVYHDENGNGKLDKGFLGKPLERYGFSNNVRGFFSRPKYEKAVFELNKPEMTVNVTVE